MIAMMVLATSLAVQADQQALAQRLRHADRDIRYQAFVQASSLGRANTGPELRAALIDLLETNNRLMADARRQNKATAEVASPEFIMHVAHVVSQLADPRAIPALAGALSSGSTLVRDALAEFGEPAAPEVLRVVTAAESHYSEVNEGLIALRFMVEGQEQRPLTAPTLERIRRAALQRLSGKQFFTTLWYAIDLAVALNDVELRRSVESLATHDDTVAARGVQESQLIQRTRAHATGRLRGERILPAFRSIEERDRLLRR